VTNLANGYVAVATGDAGRALGERAVAITQRYGDGQFGDGLNDYALFGSFLVGEFIATNKGLAAYKGVDLATGRRLTRGERTYEAVTGAGEFAGFLLGGVGKARLANLPVSQVPRTLVNQARQTASTVAQRATTIGEAFPYRVTVDRSSVYTHMGAPLKSVKITKAPKRTPHRSAPRIEDGNSKEGFQHIDERHISGTASEGPGDLFAGGTTRIQIEKAARIVVEKGHRTSSPGRAIQTFQKKIVVNRKQDVVRVIVDADDGNRVITIFPVRGGQ
jgi:hypothetical protein